MHYMSKAMRMHQDAATQAVDRALAVATSREYSFMSEPGNAQTDRDLVVLRDYARTYQPEVVILVGIGGSYLGAQALYTIIKQCSTPTGSAQRPAELLCVTGVDGTACRSPYHQARDIIMSGRSFLLAIVTKTGQTFETALHAQGLYELARQHNVTERIVVITDSGGCLAQEAAAQGLQVVTLPANLGGRYSVMSAAGCGVLELCGIPSQSLRTAAGQVTWADARDAAIFWYSAWLAGYQAYDTFTFMSAYAELGQWCRQLIGESLGKEGRGFLPTVSLGSQDLHSVAQYYLGGPQIVATQLLIPSQYTDHTVTGSSLFTQLADLPKDLSLAKLHHSIIEGVLAAYQDAGRPFIVYTSNPGSSSDSARWMQSRMCETILLGHCLEINPLDQPQVQLYKERTRKLW